MNKENVYIEPEDDITDIITKIEKSKAKIVALVPPKKAGVLRSVVNMKLIAKASKSAEKNVVLVTVDPSITKLAATSKLPVAKDLQSAPSIPKVDNDIEETSTEEVDEDGKTEKEEELEENTENEEDTEENDEEDPTETENIDEDEEEEEKPSKKTKKKSKSKGGLFGWIKKHKKLSILILILLFALIGFLIWALFIAPAVDVFVSIKTETNNFSEPISFVNEQSKENIEEGKIYLEERKIETVQETTFEPTGKKNVGEKASGKVVVYTYFKEKGSVAINSGSTFTINGLSFISTEDGTLSWNGQDLSGCENAGQASVIYYGCLISKTVGVRAAAPGSNYNIAASESGWNTTAPVSVVSRSAMAGGTDNIINVVQQSDIEKAKNELSTANEEENKNKLYESIPEDSLILESTFNQTTSAATSTPGVDEEVKEGEKATLKTTTTTSVYIIDKTKLEELIRSKVNLPDDKKIYEIRNVYIDGFKQLDSGYTGKLKAIYFTGPKLTETELVEKITGKGLGDARREISDIDGVAEVRMDPSYPWVFVVPTDTNRITVSFEIKDQNGETITDKTNEKTEETDTDKKESEKTESKE